MVLFSVIDEETTAGVAVEVFGSWYCRHDGCATENEAFWILFRYITGITVGNKWDDGTGDNGTRDDVFCPSFPLYKRRNP